MDILYIIGKNASKCNNNELRYSLRSIEKYGKNVGRVFVVGYCPAFLSDEVVKLPFEQPYSGKISMAHKCDNIRASIEYAVENSDIGDEFLISMDDHFYVREVDFGAYPYYVKDYTKRECRTELPSKEQDKEHQDVYTNMLRKTRAFLEENNLTYWNFSPHRNMHCTKEAVAECKNLAESGIEPMALWLNWMYTNEKFAEKTVCVDVKLKNGGDWWKTDPRETEVFSTSDFKEGVGLDCLISSLYPEKSKYEI